LKDQKLTTALIAAAGDRVRTEIDPITDIRSTREYRQQTCRSLLVEALMQIKKVTK
jgi:CO/xanthine dehydrogenase FAD-binding subunit